MLHMASITGKVLPMNTDEKTIQKPERIAKVLARAGIASRREVERMIAIGRIKFEGKVLTTPAFLVHSLEGITVDGQPITTAEETRLWRHHKPREVMTTHHDPEGRKTVFESLPDHMPRVIAVGRLDMNTEGLLLLTNDGELARWLELPANKIVRTYRVRVHGRISQAKLDGLKGGVVIDGVQYGKIEARLEKPNEKQSSNSWIVVSLTEGKNREVRKIMAYLGLEVSRLMRTNYGPFTLGTLKRYATAEVSRKQLSMVLKDFFDSRKGTVALNEENTIDPKKWAKAKPKKKKPGDSRRRKLKRESIEGERPPFSTQNRNRRSGTPPPRKNK